MENVVELDDLKSAWQTLDRRLAHGQALAFERFKEERFDRIRSGLWPMRFGQVFRIVFGAVLMIFAAPVWVMYWHASALLFCGLILHAYGLALCVAGARVLWSIGAMDYAAPVLEIQQQLARLRAFYVRSSFWLGNAWWVLWPPLLVLWLVWTNDPPFAGSRYPDGIIESLYRQLWPQLAAFMAFGFAGFLAFAWLYRVLRCRKPDAVRRLEDQSSRGIADARRVLEEIARFERE